jgi:predicted metal-dependent hydrolase
MMEYELIRSRRRSLALQLKPDGTVLVRAPLRVPKWQIEAFLRQHWDWVERQRTKQAALPKAEKLSEEELAALKKRARRVFPARAAYYAPLVGVSYSRVTVRSQRTKWGSCSSKGGLNFNCLLLLAPTEVLDYVVVHELCHRLEMNHSARFWAEVERVLPDYAAARKWLRQNGGSLLARLPE